MTKTTFKYLLFLLILVLFFLPSWLVPAVQAYIPDLQVAPVVGYFGKTKKPNFYGKRWMSGEFQKSYESFVKAKNPLQSTAVRLKSQMDYSLYGDIMHANILSGKNGFLFQKEGCEGFIGRDFKGEKWITEKADKLAAIVDYFKKEGIAFLVLTPPLKSRIYQAYLPDFYQKNKTDHTNWNTFPNILRSRQIPVLDFAFMVNHEDFEYALYPPSGQHWTKYGAAIASEAIKDTLEKLLQIQMVEMKWKDSIAMSDARVAFDNELVAGANFIWNPPLDPLPYPDIRYLENEDTQRPSVLAVGDSFYKLIYEFGIVNGLFNNTSTFWYYNHEVYPVEMRNGKRITNKDLNLLAEIRKRDVVVLTVFEENLDRFAFGFIDTVYDLLEF
ncbi:MAG: hypothetical protein AAF573_01540 [Bacteroidota bacterium]